MSAPDLPQHLAALAQALAVEAAHAEREHRRLEGLPLPERIAAGLSLGPLAQVEEVRAGRRRRVTLRLDKGILPHDGIGSGDPVLVLPFGADAGDRGLCVEAEDGVYDILMESPPRAERLELRRAFDRTTFQRYAQGLRRAGTLDPVLAAALLSPPNSEPADVDLPGLHPAQLRAARLALGPGPLVAIQGPPGTGKTRTIVAILAASEGRCLALADSNAAVDHLARQASQRGLHVVRMGHPARVHPELAPLTLDRRIADGLLGQALDALDRDLDKLWGRPEARRERQDLLAQRRTLYAQARGDALSSADCIAATLGTAAGLQALPPIERAIVDEATQALEPAIWACAHLAPHWTLVGDPEQLGPVVLQPGNPLETSLLQRLVAAGHTPPMLARQHRMHRSIQALVADRYDAALHPDPSVAAHRLVDLPGVAATPLTERPTLWVDSAGAGFDEAIDPITRSTHNPGERRLVLLAVRALLAGGLAPADVAVLAPYSAQITRLREDLTPLGVECGTINAFQGREAEAVVVTWCRSNDRGDLGFVADGRRLTVALSRARRLLLCVGDSATLAARPRFAAVVNAIAADGGLVSAWEEPWSEALQGI